jgi:hypothetical protein
MPLPSITKHNAVKCSAKSKRTRLHCNNPAAHGCKTCRMHGARKTETIKRGKDHPNYVHGERSLEGIQRHREVMGRIKMLTKLAKKLGMIM